MLIIISKHEARKKVSCLNFFECDGSMTRRDGAFLECDDANFSILCTWPDDFLSWCLLIARPERNKV